MNNQQAYNIWSESYDSMRNKTRDLEAIALRELLSKYDFSDVLELGCGTGKNTAWLSTKAKSVVAADFSAEMLAKAKAKNNSETTEFRQIDLREEWRLPANQFDLITCSLALEHINNIDFIFGQVKKVLREGGFFYIGELHPFKQYLGSKARFETASGWFELECFVHHVSDFFAAGQSNQLHCVDLKEWFDQDDETTVPRLLTMVFSFDR